MSTTWELTLSFPEAICLAAQAKMSIWPGIPSLTGSSEEEINQLIQAGYDSLIARGLIALNEDGYPFLYSAVKQLIEAVRTSWKIFCLTSENGIRWLFLKPEVLLEQEITEDHQIRWTAVQNFQTVQQRTCQFLKLNGSPRSNSVAFQIPLSAFRKIVDAQDQKQLADQFAALNIPDSARQPLMEMFGSKVPVCSVTELNSINPSETAWQVIWQVCVQGAWEVEIPLTNDENYSLSFHEHNAQELQQKIEERMIFAEVR